MRVSRLEIFGFKSFMDRLVLPLDGGITGVVGPNGCGKSNIVDALRWVLGETHAKNLRGGLLEDVIFNGTDKLRPLGLAEVTMTLRASGENFFSDLVSPDLEAELVVDLAEEEATAELLAEDGVGTNGEPSMGPEEEPSVEPGDRPHLTVIEGQKGKTEPSVKDMEGDPIPAAGSATLINRFAWLKSATEVQVTRRLYRSGESEFFINRVPCRLKDLKEFFRAVGVSARAYTIVAQGEVSRIVTAKPEQRRLILEEAAGVIGFRDKIAAAERRLKETEINISRLDDIQKEVTRQVNSLRRQAAKAENRERLKSEIRECEIRLFRDEEQQLRRELKQANAGLVEAKNRESSVQTQLTSAQADEEQARSELMSVDVEGDDLRSRIDGLKEEMNNRARERSERSARVTELRAFQSSRETELKRLDERHATLRERRTECLSQVQELERRERELSDRLKALDIDRGEAQLLELARKLKAGRELLKVKENEVREIREQIVRAEGELEVSRKQLVAASPLAKLKESLGKTAAGDEESGRLLDQHLLDQIAPEAKPLIDALHIPLEHVRAVQAALAEKAGFLVADNPYSIARTFEREILNREVGSDQKEGELPGIGVVARDLRLPAKSASDIPFTPLEEVVQVSDSFHGVVSSLLGNTYLAPTLGEALQYFESGDRDLSITLVTPEGDTVTSQSFLSLRHEGGVVQLKAQIEQAQDRLNRLSEDHAAKQFERDELTKELASSEKEHADALTELQERQGREREVVQDQARVRGHLHSERRILEQIDSDLERLARQVADGKMRLGEYQSEQQQIERELAALVPEEESQLKGELGNLNERYLKLDEHRRKRREDLSQSAEEVDRIRRELDSCRSAVSEFTLTLQKGELEEAHLREKVEHDYMEEGLREVFGQSEGAHSLDSDLNRSPEDTEELTEEQKRELGAQVVRLKTRINREGEVDPTSVERFQEEKQRLEELESQKGDLEAAAHTLRKTVERLRTTSIERFTAVFERVKENFSTLTPRLFGGGKGSLELEDPANPLDSGVLIIARPPGKKLKSIDLLSGGEKALCATALIFSMFLVRPSPLCVLDEVDAPLDDANLVRFLSLVKEMSRKTQFLLITHNKGSMAASDRLVGVTMQQPGASNVITVSLQEAYQQVA